MNLAYADNNFNISETLETNNSFEINYTTSAWQTLYGEYNYTIDLSNTNTNFSSWEASSVLGNIFYSDYDANYLPTNLVALDTTGDIAEVDSALKLTNYYDSLSQLYDPDNNGDADVVATFNIGGVDITNVPIINSTNSTAFITGILWDSADGGAQYDGTQDLIFVTKLNSGTSGFYGVYDYEVRIPSSLEGLVGATNLVKRIDELK